jgi:hypothetical protein
MSLGLSSHQARSLGIFIAYNTTCFLVACRCIGIIAREKSRGRASAPSSSTAQNDETRTRRRMRLFSVAAALSIATTWYFMIRFYIHSYETWVDRHTTHQAQQGEDRDSSIVLLASWLRDTQLFEQAWSAVVETPTRLWWSQQIFGFCAGWSVFLGLQGESIHL